MTDRGGAWRIGTTKQVAEIIGVSPITIRSWRKRGYLTPIREDAKQAYYSVNDVQRCASERLPKTKLTKMLTAWELITSSS